MLLILNTIHHIFCSQFIIFFVAVKSHENHMKIDMTESRYSEQFHPGKVPIQNYPSTCDQDGTISHRSCYHLNAL